MHWTDLQRWCLPSSSSTFSRDKGVTDHKQVVQYTAKVGIVAVVLLCLVYGALCFVGSQTSGMEAFANGGVLLNYAVYSLFGKWGNVILGIAMILACMTTSIGLTTALGDYFTKLFPKISHRLVVTVVTLFTWFVSNVGLDTLLDTVLPLLVVLYPLVIVLVLLSFFDRFWKGRTEVYAFSMLFSLFFSIFDGCKTAGISLGGLTEKVMQLPLASLGIGWVLPALVGFLIGISPIGRKIGECVRNR